MCVVLFFIKRKKSTTHIARNFKIFTTKFISFFEILCVSKIYGFFTVIYGLRKFLLLRNFLLPRYLYYLFILLLLFFFFFVDYKLKSSGIQGNESMKCKKKIYIYIFYQAFQGAGFLWVSTITKKKGSG